MDKRDFSFADLLPLLYVGAGLYALNKFDSWFGNDGDGEGQADPATEPYVTESPRTMSDAQVRVLVDRIFGAIYGDGSFWAGRTGENEGDVFAAMLVPRTEGDVVALINEYGVRGGLWSLSGPMNLPATLRTYLSAAMLNRLNADYVSRGINFRF